MGESKRHPVFARFWAKMAGPGLDKAGIGAYRDRLLAGLTGEVLEVGAGNGLNFSRYPSSVERVVAVEPEPTLRTLAEKAAASAPVAIEVVEGSAEHLPVPDGSFDAAVACVVLCSVADQAAALAELHRVLRPGGTLRFFEHVQAESPWMQRVQKTVDATIWPLLFGGCHSGRDTASAITAAGFEITELDRFDFPPSRIPVPAAAHILGTATR
jgi:ubiquinone/menaquinone biosynthesis C-methylase UbiE